MRLFSNFKELFGGKKKKRFQVIEGGRKSARRVHRNHQDRLKVIQ